MHGDSLSTAITIVATGGYDDRPIPGVRVEVALANSSIGMIEYVDPLLADTTNSLGRANLIFHSYALAGDQIISAHAFGSMATATLTIREFDYATFAADFELYPDTVSLNEWVQPNLQVHILSNGTIPVPGLQFPYGLTSPFGSIPPFGNIGPTDENGFAETELPLNVGSTEWTYCVYISAFASYDTVCVTLIH